VNRASLAAFPLALVAFASPDLALAQRTDILEQHLQVDLTGNDIAVDIVAKITAVDALEDVLIPTLALPIETAEVDGVAIQPVPDPMYPQYVLHLVLGATVAAGRDVVVHVKIRGTPDCVSQIVPRHIACEWTPSHEAVLPFGGPAHALYLFNLFATDAFTGDIVVHAPAQLEIAAGQGSPTAVSDAPDGTKSWTFAFNTPTELVPIYATDGVTVTSTAGFRVRGYFHDSPMSRANMVRAVNLAGHVFPFYGTLYDLAPPIDEAHILIVPPTFEFGGLGFLGNVMWSEIVIGVYDFLLEQGVAHEFAHTWWGNIASAGDPNEAPFFSESFAEYSAWRALGDVHGDDMRTSGVRMNAVWYMYTRPRGVDVAILDPNVGNSPAYVHATYHKASTVVRTLEEAVGTDAFTRALRRFVKRGPGGLGVDTLIADIRQETGYDATPDVDQWMRRTGYPTIAASATVQDAGATVQLDTQGGYRVHVPVRFTFADGTRSEQAIEVEDGHTEKQFQLPHRPIATEIDPRWTFVREVKPATAGDATLDGEIDAADLIEIALHRGALPPERRRDGHYDPFYDVDGDRKVDDRDLDAAAQAAHVLGG
jgi:peptidase M1-like protein